MINIFLRNREVGIRNKVTILRVVRGSFPEMCLKKDIKEIKLCALELSEAEHSRQQEL